MNILLTNENRGAGGAERFTLTLARALQARHRVAILTRPGAWLTRQNAVEVHTVPFSPEWDPRSIAWLARHRYDVVHCQANRDMVAASLACRFLKTEHSFLDQRQSWLTRRAYRRCQAWVAVSEALRESTGATHVIPNGYDPPPLPEPPERMRVGIWLTCVASLIPGKGHATLLAALEALPEVQLALVGGGFRVDHPRVWQVGQVEDPLPYLVGATVAVVPSLQETFSLACLEAMALGKPLVASRTGGIPELVEHGVGGWLVAPGDADDLALALRTLLSDASLRAQLSLGARARSAQFSVGGMVAAYEALYLRCMEM